MIDRDHERRLVESFLDATGRGARALLIDGEPGIGKSTLWSVALDAARERGYAVRTARPTSAESSLAFATLADLFGEMVDDERHRLPPPQQAALDVALMRANPPPEPMPPLALSLAVLELLRLTSASRPMVLAIDDVHWLDPSSGAALRFALRRLDEGHVVLLATRRVLGPAPVIPLVADLPADRVTTVPLAGLPLDALETLLETSVDGELAPSTLRRIHRVSAGNPLHAIELARSLATGARGGSTGDGMSGSLAALVRERLTTLSPEALAVVTHAHALAHPSPSVLRAALGEAGERGLAEAREADILVVVAGDRLRFTHPLLGSEAYGQLGDDERRELHRRLAAAATDADERAWHLASAAPSVDAAAATELDAAVAHAVGRGAPDVAADLAEVAARLTPIGDPARAHRWAEAGRHRLMAGDLATARDLLERALHESSASEGRARAELLHRLAVVRQLADDFDAARELGLAALDHVDQDLALAVEVRLLLAGVAYITGDRWADGARHAFDAMRLAEESGDHRLLAMATGKYVTWRYVIGQGYDMAFGERVRSLAEATRGFRALDLPEYDVAVIELAEGLAPDGIARLHRILERAEREGDYSSLPFLLARVGFEDMLDGRWADARERIGRALRLATATGQATALVHVLVYEARIEARLGNADRALEAATEAFALMDSTGWRVAEWWLRADLAGLEVSRSDPEAAIRLVAPALDAAAADESGRQWWAVPPAADALVALGRHDEARAALDELAGADPAPSIRVRADALRVRARLLAASGELEAADLAIEEAEAIHRRLGDRWELARTLLVAGEVHRRARRRARARTAYREALETFTFLGARLWAQQAREQLGRTGIGRRTGELTAAQRRVAALAAEGLTNREVGDRLSMSAHTVEAHLSEVYRSLGIRSRRDLAPLLSGAASRDTGRSLRDTPSS